jgi:Holliday junction resolvase RusA-like endonuclease
MKFDLPRPLSINRMFGNSMKGRRMTQEYIIWRRAVMGEIMMQRIGQPLPQWPVSITITLPDSNGKADIGNYEKGVTDSLVAMAIIPDDTDKYVRRITLEVGASVGRCIVALESMA